MNLAEAKLAPGLRKNVEDSIANGSESALVGAGASSPVWWGTVGPVSAGQALKALC